MTKLKVAGRKQTDTKNSLPSQQEKLRRIIRKSEQNPVQLEDNRTYLLVFKTDKARIEGTGAISGWMQGFRFGDQDVTVVKGHQVKELQRLKIPYEFFIPNSNGNGHHIRRV